MSETTKQKRWKVELHGTVGCYAEVEVEADTKDEAEAKAADISLNAKWTYDCSVPDDVETGDVEEIEDEP